ncbi:unnamed protein product [Nyctereutes procyonoides]|uniref:(raccoon dog) hypothetical protein n=1 Tax=Nyctereutes procyonoides TaxID=34880 RepID=A0A811YKU2_NYCPR|nr:unnamed protein product [Nyctereutes procyonoides]
MEKDGRPGAIRRKTMKRYQKTVGELGSEGLRSQGIRRLNREASGAKGHVGGGDEGAEPRRGGRQDGAARMERTAKGRRRLGTAGRRSRGHRPGHAPHGPEQRAAPGERGAVARRHPEGALHGRPHRPSAGPGPGSDRERASGGRRRRPLPAGPGAQGDGEDPERLTFRPARPPPPPVGPRSSLSCWNKTALPGSAPSRPGPPHIAIAATATTAAEEPVRHRGSATGPKRPASMRSRPSPKGTPASRRYLRSTGLRPRGPAPGLLSPPHSSLAPPLSKAKPRPFQTPRPTPPPRSKPLRRRSGSSAY